jgi:hypothetical protein
MLSNFYEIFYYSLLLLFVADFFIFSTSFKVFFPSTKKSYKPYYLWVLWFLALFLCTMPNLLSRLLGWIVLWAIFRKKFILNRWSDVRRGVGAPGFMSHWTARYILILQILLIFNNSEVLIEKLIWVIRFDFAWIMICAGFYKSCVGYLGNSGMEYGQVNPMWGYFWRLFKNFKPSNIYFRFQNFCGSFFEILAGVLFLFSQNNLQIIASIIITLSFLYVAIFIRLGRLAYLMALIPFVFFPHFSISLLQYHQTHSLNLKTN